MEERGVCVAWVAEHTGWSSVYVRELIDGRAAVGAETATALERLTGIPARMYAALEADYQEAAARLAEGGGHL